MAMQNRPTSAPVTTGGGSLVDRLIGVVTLKAPTYREIADDTGATTEAGIIVVVVGLIVGIVSGLIGSAVTAGIPGVTGQQAAAAAGFSIGGLLTSLILALIGWFVGGWLNAFVARTFFQGRTNTGEMLRVFGYAQVFEILTLVPIIGWIAGPILHLIGNIIGIREAAEFDTGKAVLTAIIAFVIYFIIVVVIVGAILATIFAAIGLTAAATAPR